MRQVAKSLSLMIKYINSLEFNILIYLLEADIVKRRFFSIQMLLTEPRIYTRRFGDKFEFVCKFDKRENFYA